MTVYQVAQLIKHVLAEHAPLPVRVVGEVSNFTNRTHWFFSLKDEQATIRCVCFASAARRAGFVPGDGTSVVATGRLDYYEAQGHLQLYVDKLEPVGLGSLEMRLRALLEELRLAGYFDEQRKKPLPLLPRKVAVVTSRSGAALQDVIKTAHHRWPGCRLYLVDVLVQGAQAAPHIARAIEMLSRDGPGLGIEAIIVTRGGGSLEDLWAFNERIVADALFRCRLPVVAAIGHETDTTVAELVADVRASTPTQAVMRLLPDARALHEQLTQTQHRLHTLMRRNLVQSKQQVESLARNPLFRRPQNVLDPLLRRLNELQVRCQTALPRRLAQQYPLLAAITSRLQQQPRQRLALAQHQLSNLAQRLQQQPAMKITQAKQPLTNLTQRLDNALRPHMTQRQQQLDSLAKQLQALAPQRVLERGFSYTLAADGAIVRKVNDVKPGDAITTVLAQGRLHSRVEGEARSATPVPRRKAKHDAQPGLFSDSV